jgi:DNA-binding MarR family transcriptional regulator
VFGSGSIYLCNRGVSCGIWAHWKSRSAKSCLRPNPHLGVAAAAAELGLAANTVSTLVRQLCTAGLLIREGDPDDGRAARLRLTDAAAERVEVWRDQRVARVNLALKHLNARDRARIESALPSLRRLSDQLRAEGAVAS